MSLDPFGSEALRNERVPEYYFLCNYRKVTDASLYDFGELLPRFVECMHPKYRKENNGECLGQCALAGQVYGK